MFPRLGRNEESLHDPWTGSGVEARDRAALAPLAPSNPADTASITAMTARISHLITNSQPTAPQAFLQARGIWGAAA
jgi:hypothetical protein